MSIHTIKLPDVGEGVTEAEFVELHVAVGDRVKLDQNLADVMTDKATVEVPSPRDGEVVWIGPQPGDVVAVGSEIVKISVHDGAADEVPTDGPTTDDDMEQRLAAARSEMVGQSLVTAEDAATSEKASPPSSVQGEFVIKLPDVGEGVTEAEVVEFHVAVGDQVALDENLADVMTDKATVEIPSPRVGTVTWIGAAPGETIAVGSELIKLAVDAGDVAEADKTEAASINREAPSDAKADEISPPNPSVKPQPRSTSKTLAAPAVRARAVTKGIDLAQVQGTGPDGRVTHADLDQHASGAAVPSPSAKENTKLPLTDVEEIKVIGLRRKIAEKMQESKRRIPHITYVDEIDMTAVEALRQHMNKTRTSEQPKLTVLPYIALAIVKALRDFPQMNARFDDDAGIVKRYAGAHLGIATQTDNGLMVPVMRHAETLSLWEMANEVGRLSAAARNGSAKRDELMGSTITITSLGPIGGIATTPVINYPEVAIVGPNKIQTVPRFNAQGQLEARKVMNLSSGFDHRIIDGYEAAEFVQRIKGYLEFPATLFI